MRIHSIFDNGGETADRYTVFLKGTGSLNRLNGYRMLFAMSEEPNHPQGFGQHSEGNPGKHNGKKIRFSDLPDKCQICLRNLNYLE